MSRRNKGKSKSSGGKNKLKHHLKEAIRVIFNREDDATYDYKHISERLQITDTQTRKVVLSVLNELKSEGFLDEFTRGKFSLNTSNKGLIGVIDATSRGGAYVILEDEKLDDVFVHAKNRNRALHGDTVKIDLFPGKRNKLEGVVTEIVTRKSAFFVGTIKVQNKFAFLLTDSQRMTEDLYIPLDKLKGAIDGDKVMARITSWPNGVDNPYGEVIEMLGRPGENDAEMLGILIKQDWNIKFPEQVMKEAENVGTALDSEEIKRRRDMRDRLTFTIDPWDAKDFDDALSLKTLENGNYEIGVHIADVSCYVQPGSAMDEEAKKRGNSVYLVDRVIPMLPEQLSNIACSLRPNEDKFTFSAVFEMDEKGKIYDAWFGRTVIHSDRRFTYEEAQEVIEGKSEELKTEILLLDSIAKIHRKKRLKNGALSIMSEEIRFQLDEKGHPVGVLKKVSKDAHQLIEEFMLLANKKVASFLGEQGKGKASAEDVIYRVHDKPDDLKIQTFSMFIEKFGYDLKFSNMEEVAPKMNQLFAQVKDTPEFSLIQSMAIRSMAKAAYDTINIGHYGLAFSYYTHFTSPIRRYADLIVHRLLQAKLDQQKINYGNQLKEIAKHISAQERKAIDAERESTKYFQVKFLEDKLGYEFDGTVSGLAEFGLFVRIDENHCEGMVNMQSIPGDHFYFDADRFRIIGRKYKEEYNFGDKVRVRVTGLDIGKRQIDMELIDEAFE